VRSVCWHTLERASSRIPGICVSLLRSSSSLPQASNSSTMLLPPDAGSLVVSQAVNQRFLACCEIPPHAEYTIMSFPSFATTSPSDIRPWLLLKSSACTSPVTALRENFKAGVSIVDTLAGRRSGERRYAAKDCAERAERPQNSLYVDSLFFILHLFLNRYLHT
jgi:hypothetical protein